MSSRPGVLVSRKVTVDGGDAPNAYIAAITVEIRVFAPAHADWEDVSSVLNGAFADAINRSADTWGGWS